MNPAANSNRVCPTCGTVIPAQAPAGLCPQCLMNAGLESGAAANPFVAATLPPQQTPVQPTPPGGFSAPEIADLAARFPQLEILELLGKGGMGAVYKARQRGLDRLVAIKILPPEIGNDPAFAERFTREARALGRLNHPNIVSVYDFGQSGGLYYFLMEYVEGANLRQAIRAGSITSKDALAIVGQVCDALQFAHDEGIVHRDIKPENILVDKRGRVKIADFGLAKLLGQDQADHALTHTHQVMGTLRYMAPEQMEGSKEIDHRADIFSLGVVFYELLTGELPVGRFSLPSKHIGVDVRLDEVVLRALEREPTMRYQHVSEVKTEVDAIAGISPAIAQRLFGREYRSKTEIFGWPLVHIAFGFDARTGKQKVAKGVIAIGDTAIGGVAIGGAAFGVFAFGGVALGLIALGGVSVGLLVAIGGCAFGFLAFGGLAVGGVAIGGLAVGFYAYGGNVLGTHIVSGTYQDPEAVRLVKDFTVDWRRWLLWLVLAFPAGIALTYFVAWLVIWLQKSGGARLHTDSNRPDSRPTAKSEKLPPPIPAKPWMTIVFAVFNLCLAVVLLLMVTYHDAAFWKSEHVRGWEAWLVLRNVISFLHGAALLLASIGLLLWQPWARQAIVALCVFALGILIVELPSIARIDLPYESQALQAEMVAGGMTPGDAEAASFVFMFVIGGGAFLFGLLMVIAQMLYFTRPAVISAFAASEPASGTPVDARQQLRTVGAGLIALGIANLIVSVPVFIGISVWAQKADVLWLMPILIGCLVYSLIAGALIVRAGLNLLRCESLGFGQVAVVLGMIPLSFVSIIGLPFGFWAWGVLTRREASLAVEEEVRLKKKEEIARRAELRDPESMWYDLGAIAGYYLRDNTVRWILGGLASLVYLLCLILFFSFHGERVMIDDVPVQRFSAGQPSPWFTVEASTRGHRVSVQLMCWANLFALIGVGALQFARQMEKLQSGKMHSMVWHFSIWGLMLAVVMTLGMSNLFLSLPTRTDIASPKDPAAGHGGRPLPIEMKEK